MIEVARGTVDGQQQRVGVRRVAAVLLVALGLGACTSDDGGDLTLPSPSPSAAVASPSPEPVSSPSPEDPFAVPDEIDAAYVERVLNEINRQDAELTRDILRRPVDPDAVELPEEDQAILESLYAEPILTFNTNASVALLRSSDERDDLLPADDYGQLVMIVEEILTTAPCIVARVDRDFTQTDAEATESRSTLAFVYIVPNQDVALSWKLARLLGSDAEAGSAEEAELREATADDLAGQEPEICG